jgi:CRISPR-associated DxTHG motif protein
MRTIITFLGRYPTLTSYSFQGQIYEGEVFAQALRQFIEYDLMLVLTTPEAHLTTWPVLAQLKDERIEEVPIPTGTSREELWEIFDAVIQRVNDREIVTFDITHGLRSIPFLAFLFAAYLKIAKQVKIEAIYYGALELGDRKINIPAPVLDLSEFVTMLDWITATDQFVQTGDASLLSTLLGRPGRERKASGRAAAKLRTVSQAAFLCQPFSLMAEAGGLSAALQQASVDFSTTARPFSVLSNQIVQAFASFAADDHGQPQEILQAEYNMIEWYYAHGQLIQTLTLAREWLVDAVTVRLGQPLDYRRTPRDLMEKAVSGLTRLGTKIKDEDSGEDREFTPHDLNEFGRRMYQDWPEYPTISRLYEALRELRNQLNHAEHQASRIKLHRITSKADDAMTDLRTLALEWGIAQPDQS